MTTATLRRRIGLARRLRYARAAYATGAAMNEVAALVRAWREMREEQTQ